jgi:hypothetical protein
MGQEYSEYIYICQVQYAEYCLTLLTSTYACVGHKTKLKLKAKLHGLSPRANYTDRATAACRRSDCQLLRIEGATWSA